MSMPERSFGRTVRYRRTKLGLSQAQLAELVGRSTSTVRAWERDKTRPNDTKVLSALAAILGVNERQLYEKADIELPDPAEETTPTVEQALASLSPVVDRDEAAPAESMPDLVEEEAQPALGGPSTPDDAFDLTALDEDVVGETERETVVREPAVATAVPSFTAPPDRYVTTPVTPPLSDLSYMEDRAQRQLYRVRTLATLVALVALVVAFIWAVGQSLGALGDWWDQFFGNLRL